MSADSPRRGVHKGVQVVSPQPIVDRSIIDSVAGIINDIVPQAYTGTPNSENKESISWARFEYADINDPALYPDYNEGSNTPPLLLVLGYTTGVQVWLIAATGEATEVLSWRQGVVRTLRILPNPKTDDEHADSFELKRPMVAICDSAGPGPQFCNISFISLKTGEQAKSIKFKNPVCDILANKRSIVVIFSEKIAVFDARTLEDVLTVTTCYASYGPNPNPVALGTRWLAYSEKKLLPAKRSSGGCEGEGVQSYTATVLYAAKSLGKGLRGLGETVASSLTGNSVSPVVINNTDSDLTQPGVITILDLQTAKEEKELDDANIDTVIAHFTAHSDAIVAMTFDLSGALLMTADKRGHDFHVFRIQPHPGGPTLAAVHHLYILHRGDTTAKVQDMVFSSDTRWAAISTVRGTTHVFPVAPYGGPVGVRTHSTPHVVNRLSRFHRSAGLMDDGTRSHSPVSHTELPLSVYPYSNPRLPPYPHPTILHPLAQIRQPSSLNHVNNQAQQSRPQQRQRLHSDDNGALPLKICACFAPPRAWMYAQRESTAKVMKRAVDSLFIMACHGNMIQYDLEPKPAAGVPKEKVCDDTMIELEVEAKGQWPLLRFPNSLEIVPPLPTSSPLLSVNTVLKDIQGGDLAEDRWLSQVEIVTHAGPHRRLWMGPQFVFKTYNATSGAPVNLVEAEAVEIGLTGGSRPARSNPVNMPHAASRSLVPVVIDGSGSSYEQSPRFMEAYGDFLDSETTGVGGGENQLREDLAEAMLETSIAPHRAPGRRSVFERVGQPVTKVVNPLGTVITVSADEEDINSSEEFDSAEEIHVPEPPRSVCAEEGPASLGDLEPDCQTVRDLTKICAEMRSASEPAIDSVPDENICEVKERKALCVEMAPIGNPGSSSIDFEKVEAFRDVPTSLRLCVEQGEIPSSPMTQAKETAWCRKLDGKRVGRSATAGRNISEAQYVVNCDEESVVLMENKLAQCKRNSLGGQAKSEAKKAACEADRVGRKGGRNGAGGNLGKRGDAKVCSSKKYVLKEHEDSIVIEDTTRESVKTDCGKRKGCEKSILDKMECATKKSVVEKVECSKSKVADGKPVGEVSGLKEANVGKCRGNKSRSSVGQDSKGVKAEPDAKTLVHNTREELSVDLATVVEAPELREDSRLATNLNDPLDQETEKRKSSSLDSADDFSPSKFHIVDPVCCNADITPVQSDEDIEHIHSSEIMQLEQQVDAEFADSDTCADVISCAGSSPIMQRKNSKNTISDDDLEYIHSSELVDSPGKSGKDDGKLLDRDKAGDRGKCASSDDDLEHVQVSDVCAEPCEEELVDAGDKRKSQDIVAEQTMCKTKSSKKTKDIVVIDSDVSAADVTVIFKPVADSWKGKSVEKKETTEETKDVQPSDNTSPLRKSKARPAKTSPSNVAPKRSQAGIEIIDIDAMQKAEMDVTTDTASAPECKILSTVDVWGGGGTRAKKSRKSKRYNGDGNAQIANTTTTTIESHVEPAKIVDEVAKGTTKEIGPKVETVTEVSWSSVLKKKSDSPSSSEIDSRREEDRKVAVEQEEEEEEEDVGVEKLAEPVEQQQSTRSPLLERIESLKKKIQDTSSRKSLDTKGLCSQVVDKVRGAVSDGDSEEPSGQPAEVSWSSIVRKKNGLSGEQEVVVKREVELDPVRDHVPSQEKRKNRRRGGGGESSTVACQSNPSTGDTTDACAQAVAAWCPVKKKTTSSPLESNLQQDIGEEKARRKRDQQVDGSTDSTVGRGSHDSIKPTVGKNCDGSVLPTAKDDDTSSKISNPVNVQSRTTKTTESSSKSSVQKEIVMDVAKESSTTEPLPVDSRFAKEGSSEPDRDPEKKSDSEQEFVLERSSSSDELNANVAFPANQADCAGRENNCVACGIYKKGYRSKKKKRR